MSATELEQRLAHVEQLIRLNLWESAEPAAGQLVALFPDLARAWACWGAVHLQAGRMQAAEAAFRKATALDPLDAASWHHLSITLHQQQRPDEAEIAARRALSLDAAQPAFLLQLGNVLFTQERFADAADTYQRSVASDPSNVTAWNCLGAAHHVQKNWPAAQQAYEASLAIAPAQLDTRLKLADVVERSMAFSAAEGLARQLVADYPLSADAWSLLGRVRLALAKQHEAIAALRRAEELEPAHPRHSRVLQAMQYAEDASPETLLEEHRKWDRVHAASWLPPPAAVGVQSPLRIGFVSSDLGLSPVAHMVLPLLKNIDRQRCSITCYFDNPVEDHVTPQFRDAADQWQATYGQSDPALADQIRADQIDVLVDLMGHAGSRLLVFARKPAGTQITWFGYVGTTGMLAMDYLLADRFHVRAGEESRYVETVLRMPNGYACYGPPEYAPAVSGLPAGSAGHVTFGCFNNPAKWTPRMLDVWSQILRRVPSARLLLKYYGLHDLQSQQLFRSQFAARGVEPQRIALEGWSQHRDLLAAYNRTDMALDTQPYSGGVTTCEALWMGVPVITCPSETFASRHATSHLANAGFRQFIGRDMAEYTELAVEWSQRLDELAVVRAGMRNQMRQSKLCDAKQFAEDWLALIESAVRKP